MLIGGLQKLTLVDYPGRVAATVFSAGCNFFCPFCHNPGLVEPAKDKHQLFLLEEEILNFLKSRQGMLEGVCISGGEPTIQPDLPEFLGKIKKLGFLIKLDTNGSLPDVLASLIREKLVDYVAMDIKGPLERYADFSKKEIDLEKIYQSTELVRQFGDYEFRTTIVPRLHQKKDLISIAGWLEGAKRYYLQQFRPETTLDPSYTKFRPYSDEKLGEFCRAIKPYFEVCEVRM